MNQYSAIKNDMHGLIMKQIVNKVNKFWVDYYEAVVESSITEKIAELYANWVQKFAVAIKGKPHRSQSSKDVYSFWQIII